MAVARKPLKAKKGKNPDSIPATIQFVKDRIANGETGVIERWKQKYSTFPRSLRAALEQEGITI